MHVPGVDHVYAMLQCDPDNVLLGEVGPDWCEPLANLVGLVRLGIPSANRHSDGIKLVRREITF